MGIEVNNYNLPDSLIMESPLDFDFHIWIPDRVYAVLGRSNNAQESLVTEAVERDSIPVLKRNSGGESVILSPLMVVFALKISQERLSNPRNIFKMINIKLTDALLDLGVTNIYSKGISDLSIGEKKIMGSSMYLKNNNLFYHAVINVAQDVSILSEYLLHPKKEPEYRKGRPHHEFVTSLVNEGYKIDCGIMVKMLEKVLPTIF